MEVLSFYLETVRCTKSSFYPTALFLIIPKRHYYHVISLTVFVNTRYSMYCCHSFSVVLILNIHAVEL
jgi:hypothetical protein